METREIQQALAKETHWTKCYQVVERVVRDYFSQHPELELNSAELAESIMPKLEMRGPVPDQTYQTKRLFKALRTLAENVLCDCATRSTEARERYGVVYHPWNWHAPKAGRIVKRKSQQISCPHCGASFDVHNQGE